MRFFADNIVVIPGPKAILALLSLVVISAFVMFKFVVNFPAYIAAKRQTTGLSLIQILVASTQGINTNELVSAFAIASENGMDLSIKQAKVFHLAGVDIVSVTKAMAEAKKLGCQISFAELAELALQGEDLGQVIAAQRGSF